MKPIIHMNAVDKRVYYQAYIRWRAKMLTSYTEKVVMSQRVYRYQRALCWHE